MLGGGCSGNEGDAVVVIVGGGAGGVDRNACAWVSNDEDGDGGGGDVCDKGGGSGYGGNLFGHCGLGCHDSADVGGDVGSCL